ncbi:hypothetical protein TNCV_3105591 [Trichonephila clavipes]|nr:hypothetical protein TNCV_3105591 [Trichonephila clavipes]
MLTRLILQTQLPRYVRDRVAEIDSTTSATELPRYVRDMVAEIDSTTSATELPKYVRDIVAEIDSTASATEVCTGQGSRVAMVKNSLPLYHEFEP